jgi:hypothetical protein
MYRTIPPAPSPRQSRVRPDAPRDAIHAGPPPRRGEKRQFRIQRQRRCGDAMNFTFTGFSNGNRPVNLVGWRKAQ